MRKYIYVPSSKLLVNMNSYEFWGEECLVVKLTAGGGQESVQSEDDLYCDCCVCSNITLVEHQSNAKNDLDIIHDFAFY